jgi:hypothetical protein
MPWRKFDKLFPAPEAVAPYIPLSYSVWQRQLLFMPVPNAVYPLQCRVTQYPTPFSLSNPSANSSFLGKDEIIIAYATAYLWNTFGRYDKAMFFQNAGDAMLEKAKIADDTRPDMDTASNGGGGSLNTNGAYWADPFVQSVNS